MGADTKRSKLSSGLPCPVRERHLTHRTPLTHSPYIAWGPASTIPLLTHFYYGLHNHSANALPERLLKKYCLKKGVPPPATFLTIIKSPHCSSDCLFCFVLFLLDLQIFLLAKHFCTQNAIFTTLTHQSIYEKRPSPNFPSKFYCFHSSEYTCKPHRLD